MKKFRNTELACALAHAIGGLCLSVSAPQAFGADVITQCADLGGTVENGVCVFKGHYEGTDLNNMGTEWFYLDEDWIVSSGNAQIGGGDTAFSTFIFNVAQDGMQRNIHLENDANLSILGGDGEATWGIGHLALGTGSTSTLSHQGTGLLTIEGGSGRNAIALNTVARDGGVGTIEVLGKGKLLVVGGSGLASQGINALAKGTNAEGHLINHGSTQILGSNTQTDQLANGIYALALGGAQAHLTNHETGSLLIQGQASSGIYYLAEGNHGADQATFINHGTATIEGKKSAGIYVLAQGQGNARLENHHVLNVNASAEAHGIHSFGDANGTVSFVNAQGGTLTITSGGIAGVGVIANDRSNVVMTNHGTMTFMSSSSSSAVGALANASGTATLNNGVNGTLNLFGTAGHGAIGVLGSNLGTADIHNEGTINLNRYGLIAFKEGSSQGRLHTTKTGAVSAESQALFTGDIQETIVEKQKPITMIEADNTLHDVTSDAFKDLLADQQGNLVLKDEWKQNASWDVGGRLIITDVMAGTTLAQSIEAQTHEAFGKGVVVQFDTTANPDSQGGQKAILTMDVVKALKAEQKFKAGTIITSESLHHDGKNFVLGTNGDLTDDAGFQGIVGSAGITVTNGKTLTLVGDQTTEKQIREGTENVITDAKLTLQNGTLNLGHGLLTKTQGHLAAIAYDDASRINIRNGAFTLDAVTGQGQITIDAKGEAKVLGDLEMSTGSRNQGTLVVQGQTTLFEANDGSSQTANLKAGKYEAGKAGNVENAANAANPTNAFVNESGAKATFAGGLILNDFTILKNRKGATIQVSNLSMDGFSIIENAKGATLNVDTLDVYGLIRNNGTLNVAGTLAVKEGANVNLSGESHVNTLAMGEVNPKQVSGFAARPVASLRVTGKQYVNELALSSGKVTVAKNGVMTGLTVRDGAVGANISVQRGGTFGFSHDKTSLEKTLESYKGEKSDKAILALSTDLHFDQGGSLTVGTTAHPKGTVNLGSDALLLLGTNALHGEAMFNGESAQQLHVEDGAKIAVVDDLVWGNHYLLKGFDDSSRTEILKVSIENKDGSKLQANENDRGIYITIGSDNILDKDANYRLVNQMNWLLDGRQDVTSEFGDVAFLSTTLVSNKGSTLTQRMENLAAEVAVIAENQRMSMNVQTTALDHVVSARQGYGTFWSSGLTAKVKGETRSSGIGERGSHYESDATGFIFGVDAPIGSDWRIGTAFSAQRGDVKRASGLASNIEGYGVTVYGAKAFASGATLSTALTYFGSDHDVSAWLEGATTAQTKAQSWVLGGQLSMPLAHQRWLFNPYVGLNIMHTHQDGFTSSWSGKKAFDYDEVDGTLVQVPFGVKIGSFMPLELLGRSGTLNWDADVSLTPIWGDRTLMQTVTGVTSGLRDVASSRQTDKWVSSLKLGMSYQGASGAFGLHYGLDKGDLREKSHQLEARGTLFF